MLPMAYPTQEARGETGTQNAEYGRAVVTCLGVGALAAMDVSVVATAVRAAWTHADEAQ